MNQSDLDSALSPQPSALSPQPSGLSPQPSALSPQPSALSPQPSAFSLPRASNFRFIDPNLEPMRATAIGRAAARHRGEGDISTLPHYPCENASVIRLGAVCETAGAKLTCRAVFFDAVGNFVAVSAA